MFCFYVLLHTVQYRTEDTGLVCAYNAADGRERKIVSGTLRELSL